jgi:hypothetical protein
VRGGTLLLMIEKCGADMISLSFLGGNV